MEKNETRELFRQLEELKRQRDNIQRELESGAPEGTTWTDLEEIQKEVEKLEKNLPEEITEQDRQTWIEEMKLERDAEARRDRLREQIDQLWRQGAIAEKKGDLKNAAGLYIAGVELTYDRVKPNIVLWARTGSEAAVMGMSPDDSLLKATIAVWELRQTLLRDIWRVAQKIPESDKDRKKYRQWFEKILAVPHDATVTRLVLNILGDIGDAKTARLMLKRVEFDPVEQSVNMNRAVARRYDILKKSRFYVPEELDAEWWITISDLWQRLKPGVLLEFLTRTAQNGANKQDRTIAQAILDGKRLTIKSIHAAGRYLEIQ